LGAGPGVGGGNVMNMGAELGQYILQTRNSKKI